MSNISKTKNDIAWEKIFETYDVINEINDSGFFIIKSSAINEYREARLMTKFDHVTNLPIIFEENNLAILPISRGEYIISDFEAFHVKEERSNTFKKVTPPAYIESIDFKNITSEATAINALYISGILEDFIGDENMVPTVDGRMSSGIFEFQINKENRNHTVKVENSQIEIDGGYEGEKYLTLIEAKNSFSDTFIIRQLFYPYKAWEKKVNKPVKLVFQEYSNGIFYLYQYGFSDINNYNSIKLIKQENYSLSTDRITMTEIRELANNIPLVPEPDKIPFPQANSFERVVNLCELLFENDFLSHDDITENYDFDKRQTDYYANAGRYLGLISKSKVENEVIFTLTSFGKEMFNLSLRKRNMFLISRILEKRAFNESMKLYIENQEMPLKSEVVGIMEELNLYRVQKRSTKVRRSSTITRWVKWIVDLTNE